MSEANKRHTLSASRGKKEEGKEEVYFHNFYDDKQGEKLGRKKSWQTVNKKKHKVL